MAGAEMPSDADDLMDTISDKDAKTPSAWAWTVPDVMTTSIKAMPSIIGPVRSGETQAIASLRKLTGVYVLIEDLDPVAKEIISEQQIRTGTELRLRQSGIRVLSQAESFIAPGSPMLYVNLSALKDDSLYTYRYRVELYQDVLLERDTNFRISALTWDAGSFGYAGSAIVRSFVSRKIFEAIGEFCNDFLKANEK